MEQESLKHDSRACLKSTTKQSKEWRNTWVTTLSLYSFVKETVKVMLRPLSGWNLPRKN